MDDFDPLSLFTAAPRNPEITGGPLVVPYFPQEVFEEAETALDYETEGCPIHILDMPALASKPPAEILRLVLALLAPSPTLNFATTATASSQEDILAARGLTVAQLEAAQPWLATHSPNLATVSQLLQLSRTGHMLLTSSGFMNYLTRLVSSPLAWVCEADRDAIQKAASLRLSENCGRTAQPEIIRQITLNGLTLQTGISSIRLKEPSLTADNLGLKTWGSSLMLAQRLLAEHPERRLCQPILELGAGTGLVGMVCGLLGYTTWLTDLPEIVPNLQANVELNNLQMPTAELDWSQPQGFQQAFPQRPNFPTIMISDPIYSSQHPPWLVSTCATFLALTPNARIYLQLPVRARFEAERASLWALLDSAGFEIVRQVHEEGFDDFGEQVFIFTELKRRAA